MNKTLTTALLALLSLPALAASETAPSDKAATLTNLELSLEDGRKFEVQATTTQQNGNTTLLSGNVTITLDDVTFTTQQATLVHEAGRTLIKMASAQSRPN
ncbi:MAG: hypothetical protein ABWY06_08295 [Pseudomonas sp.]|uniref:hypothetical protein n=1 Tax=Pseudomonas sp. TaxID=306 RepID=UPI003393EBD1